MIACNNTEISMDIAYPHDPELWEAIIHFNGPLFEDIHNSWLTRLSLQKTICSIGRCSRSQRLLAHYIFDQYGVDSPNDMNFSDVNKRLLLLPGSSLVDIVVLCGVTLCRELLAKVILSKPLKLIKHQLGEECYQFSMNKACFLISHVPDELTMRSVSDAEFMKDPVKWVHTCGLRCLGGALGGYPRSHLKRTAIKLPYHWQSMLDDSFSLAKNTELQHWCARLLNKMTKEVNPSCSHLFA